MISVGCASSPITTVIGGAPNSPSASTSQPWPASTACRAAASALKLAMVAPVTKAPAQLLGQAEEVAHPAPARRPRACGGRGRDGVEGRHSDPRPSRASWRPGRPAASRRSRSRRSAARPCAIVAGEPTSSSSASTSAASLGPCRQRLAQDVEARDRLGRRRDRALLDLRQVAGRAAGSVFQQFVHETSLEVTPRPPQRRLRSSRIARRRPDAHDRRARPGHDLLDRPRQHGCGRGDGILLRALRLDGDGADRERGRLPHAAARGPAGGRARAGLGRHRRLHLVDLRGERRRRRDLRRRGRERRRGRDGRDGRARRRPHGRAARPGRSAGLGLAAGPAPGLRGARRAGRADLERADDARHRAARRTFYGPVFGWTSQEEEFDGVPYTIWKRGEQLVGGALEMDESWPEDTQPHWMVYIATADCDGTARRCLRARRHGLASAGRHRPRPLRAAGGPGGRRVLGHHAAPARA